MALDETAVDREVDREAPPLPATEFMALLSTARETLMTSIRQIETHANGLDDVKACLLGQEMLVLIASELVVPLSDEIERAHDALTQKIASQSKEVSA